MCCPLETFLDDYITDARRWLLSAGPDQVLVLGKFETSRENPLPTLLRRVDLSAAAPLRLDCVVHAATYRPNSIAPGLLITMFGNGLGPPEGVQPPIDAMNNVGTAAGGTRVFINNTPVPVLFARADR